MNSKFEIIVNYDDLEMYQNNKNIICQLYIKVGQFIFPDEGWSDFIIVILSWWIEELYNLKQSKSNKKCELLFMDGPESIECEKIDDNTLNLDFIIRDEKVYSCECEIDDVLESIIKTSNMVLNEVKKRNWKTRDIDNLEETLNKVM